MTQALNQKFPPDVDPKTGKKGMLHSAGRHDAPVPAGKPAPKPAPAFVPKPTPAYKPTPTNYPPYVPKPAFEPTE